MLARAGSNRSLQDIDKAGLVHSFSALHSQKDRDLIIWDHAEGLWLTTVDGERYLDAAAGLWCTNIGYGRKELADAAAAQMARTSSVHSFAQFSNEPIIRLTERVLDLAPENMRRIVYGNSGSDANDTQVKIVRRYNNVRGLPQKKKIISRLSAYHGSTLASASLTGIPLVHRTFDLPIEGVLHTHMHDYHRRPAHIEGMDAYVRWLADELEAMIQREGPDTVAAFIAEPVTGAGGVLVPPDGYFRAIREVLDRHDVLMIADEVITGFGRTGAWFASPEFGMGADLISVSKGITSGYFPMSACLISERVADVLYGEAADDGLFGHGFTASGHSVAAAVALANIDIIENEGLLANASRMGEILLRRVREAVGDHELVGDIRGKGMIIGVEFDADRTTGKPFSDPTAVGSLLSRSALEEKMLVRGGHGRVLAAMAPALIATEDDIEEIVRRFTLVVDRFADKLTASSLRA
ncbi:MAG: aminotransferase class III-fold pyridoxal phosphate-dependent enzyme [Novosphingobium sp.]|uniref:aminotransferase family protein n=1 Tax=Novosphingobium sp. TaxID=1874826 RepID=UPI00273773DC|nr:aminotransferase class III-fold pyridoxal phosphate-dependent enzyme [Novosphingobium sp.]MDP3550501.1 aminotransferase class III-fold pyridoxal phosphate-dependent enzyme [Novosphingobium sp.]